MPDITMCLSQACPQQSRCYRRQAEPNPYRQAYFMKPPVKDDGTCDYFSPVEQEEPDE